VDRQVIAAVALATAACCGGHETTGTTTTGPSNGSGSAAPAPPAPPVVADASHVDENLGKTVVVRGNAGNAKISAAVVVGKLVVYCLGVDSWPNDVSGKTVDAKGKLEKTSEFTAPPPGPDGVVAAGTGGDVYVLRGCTFTPR